MLLLTLLVAVMTGSTEIIPVVFGIEMITTRHHHRRFHDGSLIDHDWIALLGMILFFGGLCLGIGRHAPAWGVGAMLLVFSTQLVSMGLHEEIHELDTDTGIGSPIKIVAGLLIIMAIAIALPTLRLFPKPFWQEGML